MHSHCLIILPLFGALLSGITALICCLWLRKQYNQLTKPVTPKIETKQSPEDIDVQVESLIMQGLEHTIMVFKDQIPMASMFLSQTREDQLKRQAHSEMIKILPAIKAVFKDTADKSEAEKLWQQGPLNHLTKQLWRTWTSLLCGLAVIAGLLLGLLEAWLCLSF